jgi:hypothetical protein
LSRGGLFQLSPTKSATCIDFDAFIAKAWSLLSPLLSQSGSYGP